jgi:hypothetical protein
LSSLAPVLIGLLVDGYIRKISLFGVGIEGLKNVRDSKLKSTDAHQAAASSTAQASAAPASLTKSVNADQAASPSTTSTALSAPPMDNFNLRAAHESEYERTRHYMLSHTYGPSTVKGQKFDIFIFIVCHERGTSGPPRTRLEEIEKADFFFGSSWDNETFEVRNEKTIIGVRTRAWGTFLATCRVTFRSGGLQKPPIVLHRYIDFYMDPIYAKHAFGNQVSTTQ